MSNYLINSRQKAEQALRAGRAPRQQAPANELYPAVVIAANGDGYDVATVDAQGNYGRIYERIFPHPIETELSTDDEVWLWLPSDGETPVVLAASGGGSSCAVSINAFGVRFSG